MNIPATVENCRGFGAVSAVHLLDPDGEHDFGSASAKMIDGLVQGRTAAGEGVLHVDNGNSCKAHRPQSDLPADEMLTLDDRLRGVREIRGLDIREAAPGIIHRSTDRLCCERLDTALGHLAERRHADA